MISLEANQDRLLWICLLAATVCLGRPSSPLCAAQPPQQGNDRSQDAQRDEILNSDAWRQTMGGLDEWFSAQDIYDARQTAEAKKQLRERVQKMSADELRAFQRDLAAKLEMALGPEGRDILGWVSSSLAAAAPGYRKQLGLDYPDLLTLTAAQLRQQLDLLERKRTSEQHESAAYEQARQARIKALQAEQRQEYDERQRALDRAASSAAYNSPYHPHGVRKYSELPLTPFYGWGFGFW